MKRKNAQRRHARIEPGFNLTPMLDMIFYLLFFFIMATKIRDMTDQNMDVRLPSAKSGTTVQAEATPSVTLTSDGKVFYHDHALERGELDQALHTLVNQGRQEIALRGDKRVDYGRVVEVMDWCKQAGMKSVLLELGQPEPGASGAVTR
jgi:biopolymer transport protein ExbD